MNTELIGVTEIAYFRLRRSLRALESRQPGLALFSMMWCALAHLF